MSPKDIGPLLVLAFMSLIVLGPTGAGATWASLLILMGIASLWPKTWR